MAFLIENMNNTSSGAAEAPRLWTYRSATDNLATIGASGYFNEIFETMSLGDMIYISGTNGSQKRTLISERFEVPVVTGGYVFSGLIKTADINNDAVTADKLNASVAGAGLAGGAGTALSIQVDSVGIEVNVDTLRLKDSGVTQAKLALNIPRTVSIPVSSAQWLAMQTTPVLLVAAPGANKMHRVMNVRYEFDYNSIQYTGGGVVAVQYDLTANGAGTLASATIANTIFNGYSADSAVGALGALASSASSTVVNKGLYLSTTTTFAAGNSAVRVIVTYETVTTFV